MNVPIARDELPLLIGALDGALVFVTPLLVDAFIFGLDSDLPRAMAAAYWPAALTHLLPLALCVAWLGRSDAEGHLRDDSSVSRPLRVGFLTGFGVVAILYTEYFLSGRPVSEATLGACSYRQYLTGWRDLLWSVISWGMVAGGCGAAAGTVLSALNRVLLWCAAGRLTTA